MQSELSDLLDDRLSRLPCCLLSELFDLPRCCLGRLLCRILSELSDLLGDRLSRLPCCLLSKLFDLPRRPLSPIDLRLIEGERNLIEGERNAEEVHVGIEPC